MENVTMPVWLIWSAKRRTNATAWCVSTAGCYTPSMMIYKMARACEDLKNMRHCQVNFLHSIQECSYVSKEYNFTNYITMCINLHCPILCLCSTVGNSVAHSWDTSTMNGPVASLNNFFSSNSYRWVSHDISLTNKESICCLSMCTSPCFWQ